MCILEIHYLQQENYRRKQLQIELIGFFKLLYHIKGGIDLGYYLNYSRYSKSKNSLEGRRDRHAYIICKYMYTYIHTLNVFDGNRNYGEE